MSSQNPFATAGKESLKSSGEKNASWTESQPLLVTITVTSRPMTTTVETVAIDRLPARAPAPGGGALERRAAGSYGREAAIAVRARRPGRPSTCP